jgi:4-amino-4-deoxy-L-arabinose transferase-like glycosyltransferase
MAALLGLAGVYWLWLGLTQRSVSTDPGISILAAQSILDHGYPLLPSGVIYYKGLLPSYVVAGSIAAFGVNDFSITLPSLLMGLGSLYLVYCMGRDVLGRPWLGFAAAVILIVVETHSYYAVSPRMYMSLQFFATVSAYSAWRGHIQGSRVFRVVTTLAVAGATLSHPQGSVLIAAVPVSIITVMSLKESAIPSLSELRRFAGLIVFAALYFYFFLLGNLPQPTPVVLEAPVIRGSQRGLNLDPAVWASQLNWLEHTVPLGLLLAPVVAVLGFRAFRDRREVASFGILYLLLLFGIWALGMHGYIKISGTRFWIGIAPVYVLLLLLSIDLLREWFISDGAETSSGKFRRRALWSAPLVGWAAVVILGISLHYGPMGYPNVLKAGYGIPCSDGQICSPAVERHYDALKSIIEENDVLISTRPFVASYYLRRPDGWLGQLRTGTGHAPFNSATDAYFGIPLIDTNEELVELARSPQRVWVITDSPPQRTLSVDTAARLQELFRLYRESGQLTVYTNFPKSRHSGVKRERSASGVKTLSHSW